MLGRRGKDLVAEVKRLRLQPGDMIVVEVKRSAGMAHLERIRHQLREFFPDHKALVLDEHTELRVLSEGVQIVDELHAHDGRGASK